MISVDCHELTNQEQLALASSISDSLSGRALALIDKDKIVLDVLKGPGPALDEVEAIVRRWTAGQQDSEYYGVEVQENTIIIKSPDPVAATHRRRVNPLPDNLKQCPFCAFVTPYDELYIVHVRSHGMT